MTRWGAGSPTFEIVYSPNKPGGVWTVYNRGSNNQLPSYFDTFDDILTYLNHTGVYVVVYEVLNSEK